MLRLAIPLLGLAAWLVLGCGSDKGEPAAQGQEQSSTQVQPLTVEGVAADTAELQMKPSGVRYQEIVVGEGKEISDGIFVEFDYNCWISGTSGLEKLSGIGTSVGRPGQAYKAQVGVHPLPGLSDGLIGMQFGGSRRIFMPSQLGFPAGHPWAGNNMIYEVIDVKEIPEEEVVRFQDSSQQRLELIRHIQDSIRLAQYDSLAVLGLDTLGNPLNPTGDGK